MNRIILSLVLVPILLFAAKSSVDTQIKKTASQLDNYEKNHRDINKKMDDIAQAVSLQKREIGVQQTHLQKIQEELLTKEMGYEDSVKQLKELKKLQDDLKNQTSKLEQELIFNIAQNLSLSLMLESQNATNQDSMIEHEVLVLMLKDSKERIKKLNDKFYDNSKNISSLKDKTTILQHSISNIDNKRKELVKTQSENKKSLTKLETTKEAYKRELKEILNKQDELKKTLSRLNIIKIDEIAKAQEDARRKEAFSAKSTADKKDDDGSSDAQKTKNIGSSYQASRTKSYSGEKTIAPLDSYKITKRYGAYTDPIYGIRVFNESISMKPLDDSKVKTVFNGKVIYADKTAVLNNVVIIEHDNEIHTIYANLSQISPDIKKGAKIKKGYVIGRVSDELVFEVTQKSYHIDPEKLF